MASPPELNDELIQAFVRLAHGDFSVRLPRNHTRDRDDTLAFLLNLLAEELTRIVGERDRAHRELQQAVVGLSENFLALAGGDFTVRAPRTYGGDPIDVLGYMFNSTAEEVGDAFEEVARQKRVTEAVLESMLDGVLVLDAGGAILRANGALARLVGREAAALVGRPVREVLAPGEAELAARLEQAAATPFRDRETLFLPVRGEALAMSVNGSPLLGPDGSVTGFVLVTRDERQLKEARAQLQMSDRLATMGLLAAGVAHEINNPISFMLANLDFVEEELEETGGALDRARLDEVLRALRASRGGGDRVRQIVRDLKAFSRADRDVTARVDVNRLLETALGMIRNEVRHHARLVRELGTVPPVLANEGRLVQVFLNLLQNAAQAIPPGHVAENEIRVVSGTAAGGDAFVEVRDSGAGIPDEVRARMFEAFFTTKPVGVGTGLGLAICHQIVSGLGGRIEVETELGKGSRFRITLPAAKAEAPEAAPVELARVTRAAAGGRRRLLVIDDEPEILESVRRLLDREHDIDVASSGAAALVRLSQAGYDLILCDLLMPEMTGMELYRRLHATRPELAARVVFMTGGDVKAGGRDFLDTVPNRWIEKPFGGEGLRRLLAAVLPAGAPVPRPPREP